MKNLVKLCILSILVCSCGLNTKIYSDNKPILNAVNYFCGNIEGYGIYFDYSDKAIMRFKLISKGTCENTGSLKSETKIIFEDGGTETKIRELHMIDDNRLSLVGNSITDAENVQQYGNAMQAKYSENIKLGLNSISFGIDDSVYMIDPVQAMQRIKVKKFLFTVGDIVIIWRKNAV